MDVANQVSWLIIGGGIGGLTAALSIAKCGMSVHVLEQAPQFSEIGAGLQLAPNAMRVLAKLGLEDEIRDCAVFPKRLVLMDAMRGGELSSLDLGEKFRTRYGQPYAVMHRSDLHAILFEACRQSERVTLLTDKRVTDVENQGDCVRVTCADGSVYEAQAAVGADGLWSTTRQLFSNDQPICAEYVAYRGTIPTEEILQYARLDDVVMWIGPNLHFVQYPVRRKELFNQVAVFKSTGYREDSDDWGTPEELDAIFDQCFPAVANAAKYMQRHRRWPMYDRHPIDTWTSGRLTLLGDAAHPMLQYIAQGACQAIEDGACLARQISSCGEDIDAALEAYQAERTVRTARVQRTARLFGDIIHTEDEATRILRNAFMQKRTADDFSAVDWLYAQSIPVYQ
ncbi:FAD-dependent monooxygenase [Alicyclobacillus fastidiosus]|uniref:FAD-dependent monooxygenase n=1 Tax=Alicyclobacillus fastidiosus TaxID=392011 RepID=A0ABV5A8Z3_9BACL|nr:FAD-dependent monooxygenase [Alicyclobacillus fastidiosus]WEH10706.1 FAD-dependent monooxygenase [Alicyclobacillus fastidiosus]